MVSRKNEANIMVKNAVDVIFGGLGFWMFGFAVLFPPKVVRRGTSSNINIFNSVGRA